jgi:hypothetical protein
VPNIAQQPTSLSFVIAYLVAFVLAFLGALHIYWAAGGQRGKAVSVPQVGAARAFNPSVLVTLAVAAALFLSVIIVLARAGILYTSIRPSHFTLPAVLLSLVFLARAVGEFRLVGFFKSVRGTPFARWDTFVFSPLCLVLGAAILWLGLRG